MIQFKNESKNEFTDISSEDYRVYVFSDMEIRIEGPQMLSVASSGGHRVFDAQGVSHYVPKGWRHLKWKARDGHPHFVR
jgi:hypothetical protein